MKREVSTSPGGYFSFFMTNEEFRAKIYQWLKDCYGLEVLNSENAKNRKILKKIVDEFNPKMYVAKDFKLPKDFPIEPGKIVKVSDWKPYPDTKG